MAFRLSQEPEVTVNGRKYSVTGTLSDPSFESTESDLRGRISIDPKSSLIRPSKRSSTPSINISHSEITCLGIRADELDDQVQELRTVLKQTLGSEVHVDALLVAYYTYTRELFLSKPKSPSFDPENGVIDFDFKPGISLTNLVANRRLSLEETFEVARPLFNMLSALFVGNVVHRDLKGDNIILAAHAGKLYTPAIDPMVCTARDIDGFNRLHKLRLHRRGLMVGTLSYMPPEFLFGEVMHNSDLYSAILVLLELCGWLEILKWKTGFSRYKKMSKSQARKFLETQILEGVFVGAKAQQCLQELVRQSDNKSLARDMEVLAMEGLQPNSSDRLKLYEFRDLLSTIPVDEQVVQLFQSLLRHGLQ